MTENKDATALSAKNVYELMDNDAGEVMVLLYAGEGKPANPTFLLDEKNKLIEISRSKDDLVLIEGLKSDAINKIKKLETLYVCEMKYNDNPDAENEILYAYAASLKKKEPNRLAKTQSRDTESETKETVAERARKAREKILETSQK